MSLAELRQHYDPGPLREEDLAADPFDQFRQWFDEAQAAEILEPNAFTLATATPDGIPSARTVLLKGVDLAPPLPNTPLPDTTLPEAALPDAGAAGERTPTPPHLATLEPTSASLYHTPGWAAEVPPPRGFVFYTNYNSAKAHDLAANPLAAMNFYWDVMARCVRIVGQVQKVSPAETAAYFHSRPHASQLGAWASEQSQVIPNRETLTRRFNELQEQYPEPPGRAIHK